MRSATFDMIGATLMALMVLLTIGGGTALAYLAEQRRPDKQDAVSTRPSGSQRDNTPAAEH